MRLVGYLLGVAGVTGAAVLSSTPYQCVPDSHVFTFDNVLSYESPPPVVELATISNHKDLDWPRIAPRPDGNNFEWWYFHIFNPSNLKESISITFHVGSNISTPGEITVPNVLSNFVHLRYTAASGEQKVYLLNPEPGTTGAAVITSYDGCELGTKGEWRGTGASFESSGSRPESPPRRFTIDINAPSQGIQGQLVLDAISPPRIPCSDNIYVANQTLKALPNIGWTNAVPDADARANFTFTTGSSSRQLSFAGAGYHDHLWGDLPFRQSVRHLYAGHARVGPYSIVWRSATDINQRIFNSGYVARDAEIEYIQCEQDIWHFYADISVASDNHTTSVNLTRFNGDRFLRLTAQKSVHAALNGQEGWTGTVSARLHENTTLEGTAMFYEFHLHEGVEDH